MKSCRKQLVFVDKGRLALPGQDSTLDETEETEYCIDKGEVGGASCSTKRRLRMNLRGGIEVNIR